MPLRGVNHITLVVADLDRSSSFYCNALGAVLRMTSERSAYLEVGGLWLCLELGQPMARTDDSHIAFDCDEAAFEDMTTRITAHAGLWKENRSEGASLYFLDPDGHKLELHCGTLETRLAHYRHRMPEGMTLL